MAFCAWPSNLTHECNIGPGGRPQAIFALALRTRANIAFWRSPRANIALKSQI